MPIVRDFSGKGIIKAENSATIPYVYKEGGSFEAVYQPSDESTPIYVKNAEELVLSDYENRDFFRRYVFDREEDECDGLYIRVDTKAAGNVSEKLLKDEDYEFIYISSDGAIYMGMLSAGSGNIKVIMICHKNRQN